MCRGAGLPGTRDWAIGPNRRRRPGRIQSLSAPGGAPGSERSSRMRALHACRNFLRHGVPRSWSALFCPIVRARRQGRDRTHRFRRTLMKRRIDPILIGLIGTALLAAAPVATASVSPAEQEAAWNFMHHRAGPLVQAVRAATARYRDVTQAEADGYTPVLGCVSGPDMGAMG